MKWFFWIGILGNLPGFAQELSEERVYYRSNGLEELQLKAIAGNYSILDDKKEVAPVTAMTDQNGFLYWYRRVFTEVCLTGDCRPVDVGIFWEGTGDFLGLEVYREPLTKTDHSDFKDWDYRKLLSILRNDWSSLREYDFGELVDEKEEGVDGITGATRKEIASEAVENAVYTTYTLWHLIHLGEKEQLVGLTVGRLSEGDLFGKMAASPDSRYQRFLLELFVQGKLRDQQAVEPLILKGLKDKDVVNKTVAVHALALLNWDNMDFQNELAAIYLQKPAGERVEILSGIRQMNRLSAPLYEALAQDLSPEDPWMSAKLLQVLRFGKTQSKRVLAVVEELKSSDIPAVEKAVAAFENSQ